MELTDLQFRGLSPDAKTSMIYGLLVSVENLQIQTSILRREVKNLREQYQTLERSSKKKKRKETTSATSQAV
jgi:predicted ATP-grasp superfamily ATP-dependent carboligase